MQKLIAGQFLDTYDAQKDQASFDRLLSAMDRSPKNFVKNFQKSTLLSKEVQHLSNDKISFRTAKELTEPLNPKAQEVAEKYGQTLQATRKDPNLGQKVSQAKEKAQEKEQNKELEAKNTVKQNEKHVEQQVQTGLAM